MKELTAVESNRLKDCELIIATGLQTFVAVGNALLEIKETGLYKHEFNSFEDYCQSKWGIGQSQGYRLIEASQVIKNLSPMGENVEQLIDNPRKARILAKFESEIQKLIIQDLQDNNITEITANFLEGFAKAYIVINSKVKEIKSTPLFSFNSESELIEKAKSLITMPEPQIIEVEVIKEVIIDNSEQISLLESQKKQLEQSLLKKDSLLKDAHNKIDAIPALENKIQELTDTKSVDMDLEKLLETKEILKKEIEYDRENLGLKDLLLTAKAKFNNAMQDIILVKSDVDYSLLNNHAQDLGNLVQQWLINFQNIYILKH